MAEGTDVAEEDGNLTARDQTVMIRERGTMASATTMLSDAGRADRDRLLITSVLALIAALPVTIEKITLGPIEISSLPLAGLRWGALLALIYFSLSFATQAVMDFMRWRANLTVALIGMRYRLDVHQEVLDARAVDAAARLRRLESRTAAYRSLVTPLEQEALALTASSGDPGRLAELDAQMMGLRERLEKANADDVDPFASSDDFAAVVGIGRRVGRLRAVLWTNVVVNISMPLVIAAVASGPVIWLLWTSPGG